MDIKKEMEKLGITESFCQGFCPTCGSDRLLTLDIEREECQGIIERKVCRDCARTFVEVYCVAVNVGTAME